MRRKGAPSVEGKSKNQAIQKADEEKEIGKKWNPGKSPKKMIHKGQEFPLHTNATAPFEKISDGMIPVQRH